MFNKIRKEEELNILFIKWLFRIISIWLHGMFSAIYNILFDKRMRQMISGCLKVFIKSVSEGYIIRHSVAYG